MLEALGRLLWLASAEAKTPAEAVEIVLERLQEAKRLGELAALIGVE
jgi:hypothetical protein